MAKTKLYYKNGIAYYKSGGKFCRLPKAQNGLDQNLQGIDQGIITIPSLSANNMQISNPISLPTMTGPVPTNDFKMPKFGKDDLANIGNLAATGLGMLGNNTKRNQDYNPSAEVSTMMKGYGNDRMSSVMGTGLDVASSLDPTGTTAVVNAALKVGKGLGNLVKNEDEHGISQSGAQEVIGNVLDPIGRLQQSANILKKKGLKDAALDFATFGVHGNKLMEQDLKRAEDRVDQKDMATHQGLNTGNYRKDSVYAKRGVNIQSTPYSNDSKKANLEIENNEILLGNPGLVTKHGNSYNTLTSKYATKFHGDQHGEDTDGDGMEGIPLTADGGYIASDYLGLDGRPVRKQNGKAKTGKTVADEMTSLVDYLHKAEQNSQDAYMNNPVAIKEVLRQLEGMKNTAEVNKFRREVEKMIKNDQIPLEEIFAFMQENAPVEDMSPEQLQGMEGMMAANQPQMQAPQQSQQQPNPEQLMQMMAQQAQQLPQQPPMAKKGINMYNRFNRYQQGGQMPTPEGEQNMSSNRMEQLMGQAQQMVNPQQEMPLNPALEDLDPQVQQMFAQLPPEMQEEIAQLPPDQIEIAIMNAFEQMQKQGGQGQMDPMQDPAMMEQMMAAEQGGMDPAAMEQAMMAEQQALMQMGGSLNEYFGDRFRDKNKVNYSPSQSPKSANAHLPRPVQLEGHFNPQTKTHMKQMGVFQDNYQDGGGINEAVDSRTIRLAEQMMQQAQMQGQQMDQKTAIELAIRKLAQESPERKMGGLVNQNSMVGKTVKFQMGGKIYQGKVKSVDKDGNFTLY